MRLAVTGPQNTGKTTFIKDFVASFPHYHSPEETYRSIVAKHDLKINRDTGLESQKLIRDFLFDQLVKNQRENVIFDRSILDNYIYTLYKYNEGLIDEEFTLETKSLMTESFKYLDALIFIPTALDISLVEDSVRDTHKVYVDTINRMFIETLIEAAQIYDMKIITISGGRDTRLDLIRKQI